MSTTYKERLEVAAKPLSLPLLNELLQNQRGTTIVSFTACVDPKPLKKHRVTKVPFPYPGLMKVSRVNGMIGFRYQNSVNNQRLREGSTPDFEALPRAWGLHVFDSAGKMTPLILHKGQTYMEVKVERVFDTKYIWQGHEIDSEELKHFLPVKNEGERQELDKPIILRDYSLSSIQEITIGGQVYSVN